MHVVSLHCFNLNLPDGILGAVYFHVLICHLYIFFNEVSVKVFGPFLNWFHFLIVEL